MNQRVLSLDVSTKTGWAVLVSGPSSLTLEAYGQIAQIPEPKSPYPGSYVDWAHKCFKEIVQLVDSHAPDVLVIEETSKGSKNNYSQKILEFIHYLIARMIRDTGIEAVYYMTEEWRRAVGCQMSKEEKKKNKEVREFKKKNKSKIAYDKEGKRIGLVGRKHVNVRRANEIFGKFLSEPLRKKDEDLADALCLAATYHIKKYGEKSL